jgi:Dioxygenase
VGDLLENILGRHSWRPAHLHFKIGADGYQPLQRPGPACAPPLLAAAQRLPSPVVSTSLDAQRLPAWVTAAFRAGPRPRLAGTDRPGFF